VCKKAVSSSDYVLTNGRITAAKQIGKAVKEAAVAEFAVLSL
jgi:hypothetical protein